MGNERPKLSRKNPYYISPERYYELKHFCRQYNDWKKALNLIDAWHVSPNDISGVIKGSPPSNPTERQALARLYYSSHIDILESCLQGIDPSIAPYILKGVTEGIGYDVLRSKGCPCCREMYYAYYRYFFWLLSKERG